ncbi:MAG: NAD(P)-dependent glycerol-3-phosphate dehydrogenase [Alphaproteobacteria bacterium]|nr:NAD(P)-dependent glycerol-3-phosphate dehydrogenase [Alphaproteobacteria bacterium]
MQKISIIGAGAWGTALAMLCNRAGREVTLWGRSAGLVEEMRQRTMNNRYLPGIYLDPSIRLTNDIAEACQTELLIVSVPAQHMRSTIIGITDHLAASVPIVIASKGIERGSLALMSEIVKAVLPVNPVAMLSGPNFAGEAANGIPTATTIACKDKRLGEDIMRSIGSTLFRPYLSTDVIGTQIGGATKNVIAIACGIAYGKKMGENTRAALITRGLAEIARLCLAKGGKYETLMGLAGIGDLVLTCSSTQSRNFSLGMQLADGKDRSTTLAGRAGIVEGASTAQSVTELSRKLGVEMPICQAVSDILYKDSNVDDTIRQLLDRPFTREIT